MRILLSNCLSAGDSPQDINRLSLPVVMAGSRELFEAQTLLDSSLLRLDEVAALRPAVHDSYALASTGVEFVKVHDAWTWLPDGTPQLGRRARAALCLVRDPRDVAVSFAAHQGRSLDDVIEQMNCPGDYIGPTATQLRQTADSWSGHVSSWLNQSAIPVHVIRYEDLLADTAGELRQALNFLGVVPCAHEDLIIQRAVRYAAFAELQQQERTNGFRERGLSKELFFRSGRAGEWRQHLSEEQAGRIEAAHGATMERLGYKAWEQGHDRNTRRSKSHSARQQHTRRIRGGEPVDDERGRGQIL
jgi:hypothetical protein